MINEYRIYSVQCDLCECSYSDTPPGTTQNLPTYFQGIDDAEETISSKGWVVMHNQRGMFPRIICPKCNKEAEKTMRVTDRITEQIPDDIIEALKWADK